ncbi:MAG: DUF6298 domain-containing protein [Armatimonadota bacterium]
MGRGDRAPARGPLRVDKRNPRYFADGRGRIVYLTGSHTWRNLQDKGNADPPPAFEFDRYLDWMVRLNHNFMRLWAWEQTKWAPWTKNDVFFAPLPYLRTGPGTALDGKPKFDLTKFNPEYFERLRSRVKAAGERGVYVSVMLFQGWSGRKDWGGNPWLGHPYNPKNNINGLDGDKNGDNLVDLSLPEVRQQDAAYVRKVIDTVNDLDNVLYEVSNEGGNKEWNWFIVDLVHQYERDKPKQHPVGITAHGHERLSTMLASRAEWISPGSDDDSAYRTDPPPADGRKVSILDTDHVFGVGGDHKWVWKGFLRGHNVIFMDPYDDPDWGGAIDPKHDLARKAMGHTLRIASRMDLARAVPHVNLASTGYCLAQPGVEYLVYLPDGGEVQVDLSVGRGAFSVEWIDPVEGTVETAPATEGGARRTFRSPTPADAVLYLKRR